MFVPVAPGDMNTLAAFGDAGRDGDFSQVPAILRALQDPPHTAFVHAGLHALAQLGAGEALPLFERSVAEDDPERSRFALAARARLLAEVQGQPLSPGPARAQAKVRRFFRELDTTRAALNAALHAHSHPPSC
jgi:hypothetical protein